VIVELQEGRAASPRVSGATPLQQLTDQGRQKIDEIAHRYSVSTDAVMTLLHALVNSNGNMAQFNRAAKLAAIPAGENPANRGVQSLL
jgi:hypothetical protein